MSGVPSRRIDGTDVAAVVPAVDEDGGLRQTRDEGDVHGEFRAACLRGIGLAEATVAVRDPSRATELLAVAGRLGMQVHLVTLGAPGPGWRLLISTLPAGAADAYAEQILQAGATEAEGQLTVLDVGADVRRRAPVGERQRDGQGGGSIRGGGGDVRGRRGQGRATRTAPHRRRSPRYLDKGE